MTAASQNTTHRYQRWDGSLNQGRLTWLTIVTTGVRLVLKGAKTRTLLLSVLLVTLATSIFMYVFSLAETYVGTPQGREIREFIQVFLGVDLRSVERIGEFRTILWQMLFLLAVKSEMFWVMIIVSRVGPGLIAHDVKRRALPIYFAKPVTPLTYVIGKWMVVAGFIAMVTLVPNLASLFVGSMVSGGLQTTGELLGLGLDVTLSSALLCVVAGATVLALSSLSSDHRYVTAAWLALCLLPVIAQAIVNDALPAETTSRWLGCISPRDNVLAVTNWLFGVRDALEASGLPTEAFEKALMRPVRLSCAATVLGVWTAVAMLVTYWRVLTFSRSAANV